jgi:peptidoglycan/xylan/chitin deacetylase (PgdA/CDA1 family)
MSISRFISRQCSTHLARFMIMALTMACESKPETNPGTTQDDDDDDAGEQSSEGENGSENSEQNDESANSEESNSNTDADDSGSNTTTSDDASDEDESNESGDESSTDDDSSNTNTGDGNDVCENSEVTPWQGTDRLDASASPPCDLDPASVPMFVGFGWDDNAYSGLEGSNGTGGMDWALKLFTSRTNPSGVGNERTYDGTPTNAAFYFTATYIGTWIAESPTLVKKSWHAVLESGLEVGNHTFKHDHGAEFDKATWENEIGQCIDWLTKPFDPEEVSHTPDDTKGVGVERESLYGFRTPFLEYNDATLSVVQEKAFWYDCSIEEGWQSEADATNFNWPYTLDQGSPGHDVLVEWELKKPISAHPGLWELPVYPYIVPPDEECEKYGVPVGLRAKLKALKDFFDEESGKITGFDYNLWTLYAMNKAEFLATLKYSFDQRLQGNRAPMMVGIHSDYYSSKYTGAPNATAEERQEAIAEFLDYVLKHPDTRVVSPKQILDWMRAPVGLKQR